MLQIEYGVRNINHGDEEEFDVGDVSRTWRSSVAQLARLTVPYTLSLAVLPNELKCSSKHSFER